MPLQTGSVKKTSISKNLKGLFFYDRDLDFDPDNLLLKNQSLSWYRAWGEMPKKNLIVLTDELIEWYNAETMKLWFSYNIFSTIGNNNSTLKLFYHSNIKDSDFVITAKNGKVAFFTKNSPGGVLLDFNTDSFLLFHTSYGIEKAGNIISSFGYTYNWNLSSTTYDNKTTKVLPYTDLKALEIVRDEVGKEYLLLMGNNGMNSLVEYIGDLNAAVPNMTSSSNTMPNVNFSTIKVKNNMALYALKGQLKIYYKMKINNGYAFIPNLAIQNVDITTLSDITLPDKPLDPTTNEIESIGFDYSFGTQKLHVAVGLKGEFDETATDYKYKNGGVIYFIIDMSTFQIKNQNYVRLLNSNLVIDPPLPSKINQSIPSNFKTERMQSVEVSNKYIYVGASEIDYNTVITAEDSNKGGLVIFEITNEDHLWDQTTQLLTLNMKENYSAEDADFTGDIWTLNDVWDIQVVTNNDFIVYTPAYYWIETQAPLPPIQNFERIRTSSHSTIYTISLEDKTKYTKIEFWVKKSVDTEFQLWKTVYLTSMASVISVEIDNLISDTQYDVKAIPYSAGAQGEETNVDTFKTLVEYEQPQLRHYIHNDQVLINVSITDTRTDEIEYVEIFKQLPGESKSSRIGKIAVDTDIHQIIPLASNDPLDVITGSYSGNISYFKLDPSDANNIIPNGLLKDATIDIIFENTSYEFLDVEVVSVDYINQIIGVNPSRVSIITETPIDPSINIASFKMKSYVYDDRDIVLQAGTTIQYYAKLSSEQNESLMAGPLNVSTPSVILDPLFIKEKDFWRASLNFGPNSASLYEGYQNFIINNTVRPKTQPQIMTDKFDLLTYASQNTIKDFLIEAPATTSNFTVTDGSKLVLTSVPKEILSDRMATFLSSGVLQNFKVLGNDPIDSYLQTNEPTQDARWMNAMRLNNETVVHTKADVQGNSISNEILNITSDDFRLMVDKVYKLDTSTLTGSVTEVDFENDLNVVVISADEFLENIAIKSGNNYVLQLDANTAYKFEFKREIPISKVEASFNHILFGDWPLSGNMSKLEPSRHTDATKPDWGPTLFEQFLTNEQLYNVSLNSSLPGLTELPPEKQFELHFYYQDPTTTDFNYLSYNNYTFTTVEPQLTRVKSFILRNKHSERALLGNFVYNNNWIDWESSSSYYYRWYRYDTYNMNSVTEPIKFTNSILAEIFYTHYITHRLEGSTETVIEEMKTVDLLQRSGTTLSIEQTYPGLTNSTQIMMEIKVNKVFYKTYSAPVNIRNIDLDTVTSIADELKSAIFVRTNNKAVYLANKIKSIKNISFGVQSKTLNDQILHTIKFIFSADGRRWYYLDQDTREWIDVPYGTEQTKSGSNTSIEASQITYEEWSQFFTLYNNPKNFYIGMIFLVSDSNGPFPILENISIDFEIEVTNKTNLSLISPAFKPPRGSKLFDMVVIKNEPQGNREALNTKIEQFIRYSTDNGKTWNYEGWIPIENTADIRALPEFDNIQADHLVFQIKFEFFTSILDVPVLQKVDLYIMDVYKIPELVYPAAGAPVSDQTVDVVWIAPENLVEGTEHFAIEIAKKDFSDPTFKISDRLVAFKSFSENRKPFRQSEDGFVYDTAKFGYNSFYMAGTDPNNYVWEDIMGLNPGVAGFEKVNGVPADGKHYVRFTHNFGTPIDTSQLHFRIHVWDGSMGSEE